VLHSRSTEEAKSPPGWRRYQFAGEMETLTEPTDVQEYLAYLANEMRGCGPEELAALEPNRRELVLAARFDYDVRKGGFAQFFYNMHGELLREVEDMLIRANAGVAHETYVQAVKTCLANRPEYQRFLASTYTEENTIKNALHMITVAYLAKKIPFTLEAREYLAKALSNG
jgi:hypothetical protein